MNDIQAKPSHYGKAGEIDLLSPLTIRGVTFRNRIVVSPMCQYCADEAWPAIGIWCISAAGRSAARASSLSKPPPSPATAGFHPATWASGVTAHVEPLARTARFVQLQGGVAAIQLAHAGRKASCEQPWKGGGA